MPKKRLPDWVPEEAGSEFTTTIVKGVAPQDNTLNIQKRKKSLSIDDYFDGILAQNRVILSKAITLIESNNESHIKQSQELIKRIMPHSGNSIRIGVTGPPGAGKSTFIESLGVHLCKNGHKVAVLAIDPSSTVTKGAILGDKTRMELLSKEENAFIRPSPSSGTLGGVAAKTRESILLCEATGFDIILIETIGVGQNEITVSSMVDFFLLLLLPGSGDELQGIKKGVVELTDMIAINKADGDYVQKANATRTEYANALRLLAPRTKGILTRVVTCSAIDHKGIADIWDLIRKHIDFIKSKGIFAERRQEQLLSWLNSMLEEAILMRFFHNPEVEKLKNNLEKKILNSEISPSVAVEKLLTTYYNNEK